MSVTKTQPLVEQSSQVQADLITASAEKQLDALSPEHRQRICLALVRPLSSRMSKSLAGLTKGIGRRVRVGRSFRIVYGFVRDQACVVYAGLRSPAYETFLRNWDGQIRSQFSPLSESEIVMKTLQNHSKNGQHTNGHAVIATRATVHENGASTHAAAIASTAPAAEMLWHGMLSLVAGAVEQQVDATLHPLFELEREKTVHDVLKGLPDGSQEKQALNALKSDFGHRVKNVDSAVTGLQETLDGLADVMASELHTIREELGERDSKNAGSFERLESLLGVAGQAYNRLDERQQQSLRQLTLLDTRIDQSEQRWKSSHGEVVRMLRETEERESRLSDALQEISHDVGSMALRLNQLTTSIDELHRRQIEATWRSRLDRFCERIRKWAGNAQRRAMDLLPGRLSQRPQ